MSVSHTLLQAYRCHKVVHAATILEIGLSLNTAGDRNLIIEGPSGEHLVEACPAEMFARYMPKRGDKLVVYDAGTPGEYRSISPAKVFAAGYAIASPDQVAASGAASTAREGPAPTVQDAASSQSSGE